MEDDTVIKEEVLFGNLTTIKIEYEDLTAIKSEDSSEKINEEFDDSKELLEFECAVDFKKIEGKQEIYAWNSFEEKESLVDTKEKVHRCHICQKNFTRSSDLKRHTRRSHTGEKPFRCELCDAKFSMGYCLKTHMRIHTGEKPYSCDVCDAKFNQIGHLRCHARTHTGEKPFRCEICNAKFAQTGNLRFHMKLHSGEKAEKTVYM